MPEFLVVGNDRSVNILRFQELGKTVIFWGVQKYDLDLDVPVDMMILFTNSSQ